jgi:hypothetical protein
MHLWVIELCLKPDQLESRGRHGQEWMPTQNQTLAKNTDECRGSKIQMAVRVTLLLSKGRQCMFLLTDTNFVEFQ